MSELSDGELIQACRDGATEPFSFLWDRHRLAGITAARSIAPSLDPDDIVSEAYTKILALVRDGKGPSGAFRPYLYQTIKTVAVDALRSPEDATANLEEIPDLHEAGPWEDQAFDLNATARAFESLPDRWQSVLWYTEVEGMPPRKVAPLIGVSANAVSALATRAREGLQSAWVGEHLNMQLADEECRTTIENLQRYQRGKLTAALSRTVEAHLEGCSNCAAAARESRAIASRLALVLATIFLGGSAAAVTALGGTGPASAIAGLAARGSHSGPAGSGPAGATGNGAGGSGSTGSSSAGTAGSAAAAGSAGSVFATILSAPVLLIAGGVAAAAAVTVGAVFVVSSLTGQTGEVESAPPTSVETSQPETGDQSTHSSNEGVASKHPKPESDSSSSGDDVTPSVYDPTPDLDVPTFTPETPEADPDPDSDSKPDPDPDPDSTPDPKPKPDPDPKPKPKPEPDPEPEQPDTEEPGPEEPGPEEPGPEEPGPEQPGPEDPGPEEPGPEEPVPGLDESLSPGQAVVLEGPDNLNIAGVANAEGTVAARAVLNSDGTVFDLGSTPTALFNVWGMTVYLPEGVTRGDVTIQVLLTATDGRYSNWVIAN